MNSEIDAGTGGPGEPPPPVDPATPIVDTPPVEQTPDLTFAQERGYAGLGQTPTPTLLNQDGSVAAPGADNVVEGMAPEYDTGIDWAKYNRDVQQTMSPDTPPSSADLGGITASLAASWLSTPVAPTSAWGVSAGPASDRIKDSIGSTIGAATDAANTTWEGTLGALGISAQKFRESLDPNVHYQASAAFDAKMTQVAAEKGVAPNDPSLALDRLRLAHDIFTGIEEQQRTGTDATGRPTYETPEQAAARSPYGLSGPGGLHALAGFANPLYAIGPGELMRAHEVLGAAGPEAARLFRAAVESRAAQGASDFAGAAGRAIHDVGPQAAAALDRLAPAAGRFAREDAGMARVDFGLTGPEDIAGGLNNRIGGVSQGVGAGADLSPEAVAANDALRQEAIARASADFNKAAESVDIGKPPSVDLNPAHDDATIVRAARLGRSALGDEFDATRAALRLGKETEADAAARLVRDQGSALEDATRRAGVDPTPQNVQQTADSIVAHAQERNAAINARDAKGLSTGTETPVGEPLRAAPAEPLRVAPPTDAPVVIGPAPQLAKYGKLIDQMRAAGASDNEVAGLVGRDTLKAYDMGGGSKPPDLRPTAFAPPPEPVTPITGTSIAATPERGATEGALFRDASAGTTPPAKNITGEVGQNRGGQPPDSGVAKALRTIRALKGSLDIHDIFRRDAFLAPAHPATVASAIRTGFRTMASEESANEILTALKSREYGSLADQAGVKTVNWRGGSVAQGRDEAFGNTLIDNVPVLKNLYAGGERGFAMRGNLIRSSVFDEFVDYLKEAKGISSATDPERFARETHDYAQFVNAATGQGNLPKFLNDHLDGLNNLFFSTRFTWSQGERLILPFKQIGSAALKGERSIAGEEGAKAVAKWATTAATFLGTAKLAGAGVGINPLDADFGDISFAGRSINVFGGMASLARDVIRTSQALGQNVAAEAGWTTQKPDPTALNDAMNALSKRLAPVTGQVVAIARGKEPTGRQTTAQTVAEELGIPITYEAVLNNLREAAKVNNDPASVLATAGMSLLAEFIGISAYPAPRGPGTRNETASSAQVGQFPNAPSFAPGQRIPIGSPSGRPTHIPVATSHP